MKRRNRGDQNCPMARSVNVIGEWGNLMNLREAFRGVTRFDDFQKRLQMSRNLLTARLKSLVANGVMERRPINADARRLEHVLTPMGEDLVTTIVASANPQLDAFLKGGVCHDHSSSFGSVRAGPDAMIELSHLAEAGGNGRPFITSVQSKVLIPRIDIDQTLSVADDELRKGGFTSILTLWSARDQVYTEAQANRVARRSKERRRSMPPLLC